MLDRPGSGTIQPLPATPTTSHLRRILCCACLCLAALAPAEAAPGAVAVEATRATRWQASGVGAKPGLLKIEVDGLARLSRRVSLTGTRIRVRSLLAERGASGELVRRPGGRAAAPVALPLDRLASDGNRAAYRTGRFPRVQIVLNRTDGASGSPSRQLAIALQVDGGGLREPQRCLRAAYTTLTSHFTILRGPSVLADIALTARWSCSGLSF